MARDPPSLVASSELRDLSLQPSTVRPTEITIIHQQLRDLILPLERGKVLYPRGTAIEQLCWEPENEGDGSSSSTTTSCRAKLSFTPNCLTASDQLLACGGQHGELYITNRSDSPTSPNSRLKARFTSSATPIKQFSLCLTLPTRSINNSLVILPGWPEEWRRHEEERRLGFAGRESRQWDEGERADDFGEEVEEEDETSDGMREDADSLTNEDELGEDEIYSAPGSGSSIATYPNTVPFIHAPRISRLPNTSSLSLELPTTSRRTDSFRAHNQLLHSTREISTRNSSSSFSQTPGQPPIQYVTSRSPSNRPSSRSRRNIEGSRRPPPLRSRDEPRLLISNNDQTVKLFSLRSITPAEPSPDVTRDPSLWDSRISRVPAHPLLSASRQVSNQSGRITERRPQVGAPLSRFGSGAGREAVGHHEGILPAAPDHEEPPWDLARAYREWQILLEEREASNREREVLSREREVLDRERAELDEFERVVGISVRPSRSALGSRPREGPSCPPVMQTSEKKEVREERKLTKVGGARFKYAINHSSLSPDLKTMVSVGDSTDVYLFEVIDGGREFKRIGIYSAATDSGFSTAWSKDGRKFAVASQDGQVTVWDHRSSRPFAIFHTSSSHSVPLSPSLASRDRSHPFDLDPDSWEYDRGGYPRLIDPVTGDTRMGSSTSGREAARVVKFSPEGSSRDLMVFSEENTNIHIVDARTFHVHVIVPVPHATYPSARESPTSQEYGENWGIAGVGFDPTGEWLYSGTENTVVEWDLRRVGGGEGGTWAMA